jgi:hypothetical protein
MAVDFNPYSNRIKGLRSNLSFSKSIIRDLEKIIHDYNSFNLDLNLSKREVYNQEINTLLIQRKKMKENEYIYKEKNIKLKKVYSLNPFKYFERDNANYRKKIKANKKERKENKKELVNTMLEIDLKKQKMDLLDKNIYQYKTVDIDDLNEEIKKFTKKNENLENEINILTKKWTYAQSILKKPTLEIESLLEEKYRLYDLISKAESYKNRLNYAHTKKEKHEIHEECYSKLKNRSPGNFILKTKNDIRDIKIDITQKEKEINGIIKNKLNS